MNPVEQRPSWSRLFWHPHQGLWNFELLSLMRRVVPIRRVRRATARAIILADTMILLARALNRRLELGLTHVFSVPRLPEGASILYFDMGTHKQGHELELMVDEILPRVSDHYHAYGFEASQECYEAARSKFAGRRDVTLVHGALCHSVPVDGKLKLHTDPAGGFASSTNRPYLDEHEEVNAIRFSEWLRDNRLSLDKHVCLVRMNIEGSEYDVVKDLTATGLSKCIDGYYGMWDDLSKDDAERDREFLALLRANQIRPFTFNDRDLEYRFRMKGIEYDIRTSIDRGRRRLRRSRSTLTQCSA